MDFCGQDYAKVLKNVSTGWLSLERCIQRTLEKYEGLKSYFLSANFTDQTLQRLSKAFNNPLTEVANRDHKPSSC